MFSQAGCQVVPTLSSGQTAALLQDLNLKVDVIVVNPELAGVSEMIQSLASARAPKIVAIRNHCSGDQGPDYADASLERPSGWGPVSQKEWLGCVRRLVKNFQVNGVGYSECS